MLARLYYIRCDGCGRPCGTGSDLAESGVDARRVAKRKGWLRIGKRSGRHEAGSFAGADLCPGCQRRHGGADA